MNTKRARPVLVPYPLVTWQQDLEELKRQVRWRQERREESPRLDAGRWCGAGDSRLCEARFAEPEGRLVDALPLLATASWLHEASWWSQLAAECLREGGAESLRRHHHRRMEDLFTDWCDELLAHRRLRSTMSVQAALAVLKRERRIAPALAYLESSLDEVSWRRLDRRRGLPGAAWSELVRRWRVHHAFVTGAIGP